MNSNKWCLALTALLLSASLLFLSACGVGVIESEPTKPVITAESTVATTAGSVTEATPTTPATTASSTTPTSTTVSTSASTVAAGSSTTTAASTAGHSSTTAPSSSKVVTTKKKTTTKKQTTTKKKKTTTAPTDGACTISIQCKTILNHMDELAEGHEKYVPDDGIILKKTAVHYQCGDTVYKVLTTACKSNGIKLNVKSTMYGKYIAGIHHLDEFDVGKESGWKYRVNGKDAPVACSSYTVSDGDAIEFYYTCKI